MGNNAKKLKEIIINRHFINSTEILDKINILYNQKEYKKALLFLEKYLQNLTIRSPFILSRFFDIAASILWKMGEKGKSLLLWEESLRIDGTNRHSFLSLALFSDRDKSASSIFELFMQIKMNEYYSHRNSINTSFYKNEEESMMNQLICFWDENLSKKQLNKMNELELVEYFIDLKILEFQ